MNNCPSCKIPWTEEAPYKYLEYGREEAERLATKHDGWTPSNRVKLPANHTERIWMNGLQAWVCDRCGHEVKVQG